MTTVQIWLYNHMIAVCLVIRVYRNLIPQSIVEQVIIKHVTTKARAVWLPQNILHIRLADVNTHQDAHQQPLRLAKLAHRAQHRFLSFACTLYHCLLLHHNADNNMAITNKKRSIEWPQEAEPHLTAALLRITEALLRLYAPCFSKLGCQLSGTLKNIGRFNKEQVLDLGNKGDSWIARGGVSPPMSSEITLKNQDKKVRKPWRTYSFIDEMESREHLI